MKSQQNTMLARGPKGVNQQKIGLLQRLRREILGTQNQRLLNTSWIQSQLSDTRLSQSGLLHKSCLALRHHARFVANLFTSLQSSLGFSASSAKNPLSQLPAMLLGCRSSTETTSSLLLDTTLLISWPWHGQECFQL